MKVKKKVKNAIKWIDSLNDTNEEQSVGVLGSIESGFCCIGYGCHILNIDYDSTDSVSNKLAKKVGLINEDATFTTPHLKITDDNEVYSHSLIECNDDNGYSFKDISKLMKDQPELMFKSKIASGIKSHYKIDDTGTGKSEG